jgi:uncharacterized protein YbjT (DUF2867 family)
MRTPGQTRTCVSIRQRSLARPLSARRTVTVFGGTGFLGRRVVNRLLGRDFTPRIAARHAKPGDTIVNDPDDRLEATRADINDEKSIARAVADAFAVVNAISLYVEQGANTFWSSARAITERAGKNPRHPTGSHPDQQSLFSSMT